MRVGDIYETRIDAMGASGEGVCRPEGFALFVRGAVEGDLARVRVTKLNKSYGFAALLEIVEPSKSRVEPQCSSFGVCGGCAMLNIGYEKQLEIKERIVRDALERVGGFSEPDVFPIVPSVPNTHYRNKAQYPITPRGAGFFMRASHNVVSAQNCALQDIVSAAVLNVTEEYMKKFGVMPYDEKSGDGIVRHVCTRSGKSDTIVVIVTNTSVLPYEHEFVKALTERLGTRLCGVVQNINKERTNVVFGKRDKLLFGRRFIMDNIGKINYKISYKSFYQVNPHTTLPLYEKVLELAAPRGETVFDLYCGCGTISLFLARAAREVIGVEIVPSAVKDAAENAYINNITNVRFYEGAAEEIVPQIISDKPCGVVVLDPPRRGCDKSLLDCVVNATPKRIVYVSCNSATLARDVRVLCDGGYTLKEVHPFDQFPHTMHVETVVLLSKGEIDSKKVRVEFSLENMDMSGFQKDATYGQIKERVLEQTGLKVSSLYIAQIKQKHGIIERENYNKSKSDNTKQPKCPPEKEKAITEALRYFGMV
ncbi:MAG: 23S rRNA (uracil(1939)-C(5))-methyltransferase RlmD [Clostridia bacterium]|nr:23S rRNA (uracil(1939)-C(5))-methyltransferase RlmD [Clostridia bacterium]